MVKFKKKSIAAITLVFSMLFGLAGCGKVKDVTTEDRTPVISTDSDATEGENTSEASTDDASGGDVTTESTTQDTEATTGAEDAKKAEAERKSFDEYMDALYKEEIVKDTITLHYSLAHPETIGITDYEVTLGEIDLTEEGFEKAKAETEEYISELEKFDYSLLSEDQQFTYDILSDWYAIDLLSYDNPYLFEPFAYTSGIQANYLITMSEYKFYDQGDIDDYLKLLEMTPEYFNACLDFERVKSEKGLFMNSNSAGEVIRQCSEFIEKPEKNLLIDTFDTRIEKVEGLTDEQKAEYIESNKKAVKNYIIPAYESIISVFNELKDTGKNELGLSHLEGGADYYKYLLASKVGTDKSPEEIIEMLDNAVKSSMDELTKIAFSNYESYSKFVEDYDSLYGDLDYRETIEFFETAFDDRFPDIPDIDFTVTPVHESLKDSVSPAFFMTPPLDEYKHNSIYINEGEESTGSLWATLAHEGVPGHMYQFVYFLSNNPNPVRTLLDFTGYQEGWAQYVEHMSYALYEDFADPVYADLDRINSQLNLYISARVEIGVNYEGWTLKDTEDYLTKQGFGSEAAKSLMDYVVAEPCNYQMYCTGALLFKELRAYSEDALGDKFDEKEFHKAILDAGPCQFYILKKKVDAYIDAAK